MLHFYIFIDTIFIRGSVSLKYNWDLTHIYKNDKEWKNDFHNLENKIDELKNMENYWDNVNLFEAFLSLKIEIDIIIEKLYCYAKRHLDLDSTLDLYKIMFEEALNLYSELQTIYNQFENNILANSQQIKDLLKDSKLQKYHRYLNLILRRKDHIVRPELANIYTEYTKNIQDIKVEYQTISNFKFENVLIDGIETELTRKNYNELMLNPNQANQKNVFDTYTKAYIEFSKDIAKLYLHKLQNDIKFIICIKLFWYIFF